MKREELVKILSMMKPETLKRFEEIVSALSLAEKAKAQLAEQENLDSPAKAS